MSTLAPQDIKTLESTRQRLSQVSDSLATLQQQILHSDPLPPWPSVHSLSDVISKKLATVSDHLTAHAPLFSSLAVHPLPSYPGREHETILHQLLRKKLEPRVEDWVEEGRAAGADLESQGSEAEYKDLWGWANMVANKEKKKHNWKAELDFTLEEIQSGPEHVVTGLKRGFAKEADDEEDEEEKIREAERNQDEARPFHLDDFLRFMAKGVEPVEKEGVDDPKKA